MDGVIVFEDGIVKKVNTNSVLIVAPNSQGIRICVESAPLS